MCFSLTPILDQRLMPSLQLPARVPNTKNLSYRRGPRRAKLGAAQVTETYVLNEMNRNRQSNRKGKK